MKWQVYNCYPGMKPLLKKEIEVSHKILDLLQRDKPFRFPTVSYMYPPEEKK